MGRRGHRPRTPPFPSWSAARALLGRPSTTARRTGKLYRFTRQPRGACGRHRRGLHRPIRPGTLRHLHVRSAGGFVADVALIRFRRTNQLGRVRTGLPAFLLDSSQSRSEAGLSPDGLPAMRSGTLRSSSRSGQCSATPSPKISTCVHSCGVPCHSRGNHMSGTIIVRPSTRSITSDSWSTRTPVARASRTSATEELIPPLQERLAMSLHNRRNLVQLRTAVATGIGKRHRIEPELRQLVLRSHVDMRWLASVVRREEEPIRTISPDTWHLPSTLIPRLSQTREKSNSDLAATTSQRRRRGAY